jgi:hypothetical protein
MRTLPLLLIALAAACGSSTPANVAGQYTVAVTNRDNGCNLQNWTVGQSAANIMVAITQNGATADATVQGAVGGYLDIILGAHDFTGDIDSHHLSLTLFGTRTQNSGNCTWTYNANLEADLAGDVLTGTIDYSPKTNGNPDCTAMQNACKSTQDFNGTRPPS